MAAPAAAIRARGVRLVINGTAPLLGEDGVTLLSGIYTPTDFATRGSPTDSASRQVSAPTPAEQSGPYDANVNG